MLTVRSTINVAGQAVPNIIPAVQGDTGRAIVFTLADFTIPAGSTATYYVQKPSGEAVYNAATINSNKVTVELTAQALAETGDNYGQVRILNGDDVVTSFDFILLVKPFRGIGAVESTTEMNIFDEAVQNAMEQFDSMLPDVIAPEFDASTEYAAGDYVLYAGKLYQFASAHSGAWTGTDAEETTVTEKLNEGGEGGISAVAQALLINILRNATYITDQSTNITNLETELASGGGTTRVAIINTLTNCTTNNSASSITVGSAYIATITANEGYDIESASVLMGGQDVTASVYAAGVITIPNVTGTLVITVTAAEQSETGLAHYWKLTTGSIIDTIDGETELTVGANTAVTAGIGATIDAANDFITVPFTYRTYSKIKIKFGAMTNNGSGSERLIGIKYGASSTPAIALRYDNSDGIWENASNTYATAFTAADAFANNELVLERSASNLGKAIDITFGADAVISGYSGGTEYNYIDIGGSQGSGFYTVIVESIKVYT